MLSTSNINMMAQIKYAAAQICSAPNIFSMWSICTVFDLFSDLNVRVSMYFDVKKSSSPDSRSNCNFWLNTFLKIDFFRKYIATEIMNNRSFVNDNRRCGACIDLKYWTLSSAQNRTLLPLLLSWKSRRVPAPNVLTPTILKDILSYIIIWESQCNWLCDLNLPFLFNKTCYISVKTRLRNYFAIRCENFFDRVIRWWRLIVLQVVK